MSAAKKPFKLTFYDILIIAIYWVVQKTDPLISILISSVNVDQF